MRKWLVVANRGKTTFGLRRRRSSSALCLSTQKQCKVAKNRAPETGSSGGTGASGTGASGSASGSGPSGFTLGLRRRRSSSALYLSTQNQSKIAKNRAPETGSPETGNSDSFSSYNLYF